MSLLEAGVQMMDGMKMAGMIRYFYDHKGFGFINVTGNPIDIYFQGRQKLRALWGLCHLALDVGTICLFFHGKMWGKGCRNVGFQVEKHVSFMSTFKVFLHRCVFHPRRCGIRGPDEM